MFEFGESKKIDNREDLELYLQNLWMDYKRLWDTSTYDNDEVEASTVESNKYQPFFSFDGNYARAQNYVGFVHAFGNRLEIYPKVFRDHPSASRSQMIKHILFWFDYCRKIKFPFNRSYLDEIDTDSIPELIIYLVSNNILETIMNNPLSRYQEIDEPLQSPKGKILFDDYLNNGLARGRFHHIDCRYEPFRFDNKVNRIIRYCCKLLLSKTNLAENQDTLQKILFILDGVEDKFYAPYEVDNIRLNPVFSDYEELLYHCKLILEQKVYSHVETEFEQWSLLFPMEYIFEDFVAGFLHEHFKEEWSVKYQESSKYVTFDPQAFNMQHDIVLRNRKDPSQVIIIDTKYKLRGTNYKLEKKKGISQTDLYQMLSYAYRQGCNNVLLLYPNLSEEVPVPDHFKIRSGFADNNVVNITASEIPVWSLTDFKSLTQKLKTSLTNILLEV